MKCSICRNDIEPLLNESGQVCWDQGHNPAPIAYDNIGNLMPEDARCCNKCNKDVIDLRLYQAGMVKKYRVPKRLLKGLPK